jgi:threonyl-tRNA synthetase
MTYRLATPMSEEEFTSYALDYLTRLRGLLASGKLTEAKEIIKIKDEISNVRNLMADVLKDIKEQETVGVVYGY